MATTPGGLPYPEGTDFVANGDNAIRALAEAMEARHVFATFTVPSFAGPNGGFGLPTNLTLVPAQSTPNAVGAFAPNAGADKGIILPWEGSYSVEATFNSTVNLSGRGFINSQIGAPSTFTTRYPWGTPAEGTSSAHIQGRAAAGAVLCWQIYQATGATNFSGTVTVHFTGRVKP